MRRAIAPITLAGALVGVVGMAALAPPQAARAYQCTLAECIKGSPECTDPRPTQVWQTRIIPFYISTNGTLLDAGDRVNLVIQSFAVWSGNDCTDLSFPYMGRTDETDNWDPDNLANNKNVIASIEEAQPDFDKDPRLLALTLTRYAVKTGEIFDADILINARGHTFDDVSDGLVCRSQTRAFDLRNTLVHEMGHFIGFDHTDVVGATMFASADVCEIDKRDLATDDRLGVCTVYPKGGETNTCTPPATYTQENSGGCSCATGAGDGAAMVAVLAVVWAMGRRRRQG